MILRSEVLESRHARLEPLADRHQGCLRQATSEDATSWSILRTCWAGDHFDPEWQSVMARRARGAMMPFAVLVGDRLRGVTAFIDPDEREATVEIGATWLHPAVRGGSLNPAAKHLMLAHAFNGGARRVQIRVDVENVRSCAAVEKLGAVREGIARQDKVTWTGRIRDTAVYSILRDEWPVVRDRLDDRLSLFDTREKSSDDPYPKA